MIQKEKTSSIYVQLANKYNIPHQVIEVICNHPFRFANRIISNEDDMKAIMFGYLFKIKPKKKYEKQKDKSISISESVSD